MLDFPADFFIWIPIKLSLSGLVLGMNAPHAMNIRAWWVNLLRIPGVIIFLWLIWSPDSWMQHAAGENYGAGMVGAMILNGILNLLVLVLRDEIDSGSGELRGDPIRRTPRAPSAAERALQRLRQPDPYGEGFKAIEELDDKTREQLK